MMTARAIAPLILFCLPAAAQLPETLTQPASQPGVPTALQASPLQPAPLMGTRPVEAEAPAPSAEPSEQKEQLSEAEQRIRIGIVMLGRLHDLLAQIKDEQSAQAAVAPVMRASAEFMSWAQGFSSLPPLDAETQSRYEKRYLPIIDALNSRIRIQGERLASAEFYGSRDLPAALVRLVTSMQG